MDCKLLDCITEIQHDWEKSVKSGRTFWAKCTLKLPQITDGEFGRRYSEISDEEVEVQNLTVGFENRNTFIVSQGKDSTSILLECPRFASSVEVCCPGVEFVPFHSSPVFHVDISRDKNFFVAAGDSGNLTVHDFHSTNLVGELIGHIGDVTVAKFFPSSKVVLSGGSDQQLRIWGVTGGQAARVMAGHTASISDAGMIDRGREVLSCARDGTVRLWECASGSNLHTWKVTDGTVNALTLGHLKNPDGEPWEWICAACSDGTLTGCDLRLKDQVFQLTTEERTSLECCKSVCHGGQTTIAAGTADGMLYFWDLRHTGSPLNKVCIGENQGVGITSIKEHSNFPATLWISTTDGKTWELEDLTTFSPKLKTMLTGPFYQPIYSSSLFQGTDGDIIMATSSRDGVIRTYVLYNT